MSAAVMTATTIFEVLVNCFLQLVPMCWANLSVPLETKSAKPPPKFRATKSKMRRPIMFRDELLETLKVTSPTVWLWMVRYGFPKPIVCGGSRSAWYVDEVEQWLASRPRRKIKGRE
jgi:predicted DNA-binding transcriptional regulator AlpA